MEQGEGPRAARDCGHSGGELLHPLSASRQGARASRAVCAGFRPADRARSGSAAGVRVSHMALVVRTAAGLVVRHASFGKEKKVIEEPIAAFLDRLGTYREWPVGGVALARALDARGRAVGGLRR